AEVKFDDERGIYAFVKTVVKKALGTAFLMPQVDAERPPAAPPAPGRPADSPPARPSPTVGTFAPEPRAFRAEGDGTPRFEGPAGSPRPASFGGSFGVPSGGFAARPRRAEPPAHREPPGDLSAMLYGGAPPEPAPPALPAAPPRPVEAGARPGAGPPD